MSPRIVLRVLEILKSDSFQEQRSIPLSSDPTLSLGPMVRDWGLHNDVGLTWVFLGFLHSFCGSGFVGPPKSVLPRMTVQSSH